MAADGREASSSLRPVVHASGAPNTGAESSEDCAPPVQSTSRSAVLDEEEFDDPSPETADVSWLGG